MTDMVDYKIGDPVESKSNPDKTIGVCTGFCHDDTCIMIDGKCWGGKHYFQLASTIDVDCTIIGFCSTKVD